jgi:hypothetical protein
MIRTAAVSIGKGCWADVKNIYGNCAIHHAAMKADAVILRTLIPRVSDIHVKDGMGKTALDLARQYSKQEACPYSHRGGMEAGIMQQATIMIVACCYLTSPR